MATSTGSIMAGLPALIATPEAEPPYGGLGQQDSQPISVSLGRGMGFPAGAISSCLHLFRVNEQFTGTGTGVQVLLVLADDPSDKQWVASKNVYLGVTIGPATAGKTFDEVTATTPLASSTETLAAVTMGATAGGIILTTTAFRVTYANANTLAAAGWALLKIRRYGTHASDTSPARVVLLGFDVTEY